MKITDVESFLVRSHCHLVRVSTDEGITGIGEAGFWGYPEATEGALKRIRQYLVGKDPLRIDYHWQYVYRNNHHRGGALNAALSAVDIALWDIAGKYFDAPAWQLLGGKCREKIRAYMHIRGSTVEELIKSAERAVKDGFTAIRFGPMRGCEKLGYSELIKSQARIIREVRNAVGESVDICYDVHNRFSPMEAISFCKEVEKYTPLFIEDPIKQDSAERIAMVAANTTIPIATGERLHNLFEFRELLIWNACKLVRPDLCVCGGLTQAKKIAALAEAFQVGIVPHNPLSPVSTAACVQLDACIPNAILQEYTGEGIAIGMGDDLRRVVKSPVKLENGYLIVPDAPGIGVEIDEEAVREGVKTYKIAALETPLHADGSVADS
ncbi:MAG: galactonate dehydratase [Candidatus Bathyarchaeia archaeon]